MDWSTDHQGSPLGTARPDPVSTEGDARRELHVRLSGRFLTDGLGEASCLLTAVRGRSGHVIAAGQRPTEGARVVLYLDLVGRIEGAVEHVHDGRFDVRIAAPPAKWLRLVQQFEMLAQLPRVAIEDLRGFRRIASESPDTTLTGAGGGTSEGRIKNLSRSGAAVLVETMFEVGELVRLGTTQARVVRHIEGGVAVQFLRLLPLESFGPAYVP